MLCDRSVIFASHQEAVNLPEVQRTPTAHCHFHSLVLGTTVRLESQQSRREVNISFDWLLIIQIEFMWIVYDSFLIREQHYFDYVVQ